jgi:pimeloyl-ACP methyl ester carboxylesterase
MGFHGRSYLATCGDPIVFSKKSSADTLMARLNPSGWLDIAGHRLEYRLVGPDPSEAATIVMLHEGLGSVGLWGDFPEELAAATGAGVLAYSRAGYGASSPVELPRPLSYMHDEALAVLPKVLDAIGFRRGLLLGHSDGASIATLYAGSVQDHRVRGLALIAPHFIVEEMSLEAIARAKIAYESGELRQKLARWHKDVDNAFQGWNGAWLDPAFKSWDISEALGYIRVPIEIVQGTKDEYGSMRQIEIAQEECYCPVDVTLIEGAGHSPQRDARGATSGAIADFANRILRDHDEGRLGETRSSSDRNLTSHARGGFGEV